MNDGLRINVQQPYCIQRRIPAEAARERFGLPFETIAHLADRHTLAVQRWLSTRSPQAQCFEGTGLTATSTGLPVSLLNLVLSSHFPPEVDEAHIRREIEAVKAFFAERAVPFSWWLSPFATPKDIARYLPQHGFVCNAYRLPAMVAPLTATGDWPELNPQVQVWLARDLRDLKAASRIRRLAFGFPVGTALTYFEDMAEDWLRGDPARVYMARVGTEGPPVAMGALIMGDSVPGVYVMATLPKAERQGLGKAILAQILSTAASEGHACIVLTAGARAYSLYRKFGFEHLFEYAMYALQEDAPAWAFGPQ